ncbi:MAG: daptide biosynthesis RiPP recognition protein [Acidimicrobiales bacterium]
MTTTPTIDTPHPAPSELDPDQLRSVVLTERFGALLTGRRPGAAAGPAGRNILLETGAFLDSVLDPAKGWLRPSTLVFVPGDDRTVDGGRPDDRIVGYEGSLAMGGDEVGLAGSFRIQTLEYAVGPFVPVVGPTVLRLTSDEDAELFFEDADRARATGEFPEILIHPLVELADHCALGGHRACVGVDNVHVAADGQVGIAPGGVPLGHVDEGCAVIAERFRAASAHGCGELHLGDVLDSDTVGAGCRARPWLSRYLHALAVLRTLTLRDKVQLRVDGFGPPARPELIGATARAGDALVVRERERAYVASATGRSFAVGHQVADCITLLQTTGHPDRVVATLNPGGGSDLTARLTGVIAELAQRGIVGGEVCDAGHR